MDETKAAGIVDPDSLDAVAFYTERRPAKTRTDRLLFTSNGLLLGFDAFHLVGELLTQPIQVIVGGRLGATFSFEDGKTLFERAPTRKNFVVVEGVGRSTAEKAKMFDAPRRPARQSSHLRAESLRTCSPLRTTPSGFQISAAEQGPATAAQKLC